MPTAQTNGIRTYYEVSGYGQPLVLIHGVSFDHKMWRPQIPYYSKIVKIPDAFHITNFKNPEQFNRAVEGFLAKI